jgi:hypothetical protein
MIADRLARGLFIGVLLLLVAVTGAAAALQIVWGPVLGDLTSTSAQLAWYTNLPSYGWVEVNGQPVARGGPIRAHRVKLQGLQPGSNYYYRLVAEADGQRAVSRRFRFATPPADLDTFTFCAYGDTRSDPEAHRRVVRAMASLRPAFILHSGDLVADGNSLADWHQFFPVIARFSPTVPLYPVLGNHEGNAAYYYDLLPLPTGGGDRGNEWYATVFGSVQIIGLDSCRRLEEQGRWLRDLLRRPAPSGVRWRVVLFHHPPYTSGPHEPSREVLQHFCPALEGGKVHLVFLGHNHLYERSRKGRLNYVIVGGGGAPLYRNPSLPNPYKVVLRSVYNFARVDVSPEALSVTAYDPDLAVLDRFTVTP